MNINLKHRVGQVLFDNNVAAVALVSEEFKFIAANRKFCETVGYNELELQRKSFKEITDPKDTEVDVELAIRVKEGRINSYEMNKSYISKLNHLIKVKLRVDAVRDELGQFVCYIAQVIPYDDSNYRIVTPMVESNTIRTLKFMSFLRKNWSILLFALTAIAWVGSKIAEFLQR